MAEAEYISVVMSVYNEEKYISAAIKSILNQTYPFFEFIIINDGSTDGSETIIKSFKDDRIVYHKIEKVNFSAALNYGLKIAKHKYIARMDADDISTLDRLKKQMEYLNEHPEVKILSCGYGLFKQNTVSHIRLLPESDSIIKEQLNHSSAVCHAGSIYLKEHVINSGGYNEDMDCLEDIDLWLRMRKETIFHNLPEVLYLIRLKENSMSSKEAEKPKQFFRDIYLKNFDKKYYTNEKDAYADYSILLFKFSSEKKFRSYVLNNKILFYKNIFLLYVWSFFSTKNILEWLRWKKIKKETEASSEKTKLENLIKSLG